MGGSYNIVQLPTHVCGLKVLQEAEALGVTFTRSGEPSPGALHHWDALIHSFNTTCSKLARLSLSTFGRGIAASAFGTSQLLYRAEFQGLPDSAAAALASMSSRLVDRGLAPITSTSQQTFNSVIERP